MATHGTTEAPCIVDNVREGSTREDTPRRDSQEGDQERHRLVDMALVGVVGDFPPLAEIIDLVGREHETNRDHQEGHPPCLRVKPSERDFGTDMGTNTNESGNAKSI